LLLNETTYCIKYFKAFQIASLRTANRVLVYTTLAIFLFLY